jgi:hypothetical protein
MFGLPREIEDMLRREVLIGVMADLRQIVAEKPEIREAAGVLLAALVENEYRRAVGTAGQQGQQALTEIVDEYKPNRLACVQTGPDEYTIVMRCEDGRSFGTAVIGPYAPDLDEARQLMLVALRDGHAADLEAALGAEAVAAIWARVDASLPKVEPDEHIENAEPTPDGDRLIDDAFAPDAPVAKAEDKMAFPWERFYSGN